MSGLGRCPLALPFVWITGVRTTWSEVINTATRARTASLSHCAFSFFAKGRKPEPKATDQRYSWTDQRLTTNNNQPTAESCLSRRVGKLPLTYTFHSLSTGAEITHNSGRAVYE